MTDDTATPTDEEEVLQNDSVTSMASSTYKVRGEFSDSSGAGVLGRNTAGSGTPIGVEGAVPNASGGYGLSTPHDANVGGALEVNEVVESASGNDMILRNDGGTRGLLLGSSGTDDFGNTSGSNVVGGHASNAATDGALGVSIGGGGSSGSDRNNTVADHYGTVGGGEVNTAGNPATDDDPTTAKWATVGGGASNTASGETSTIAGGAINEATGENATVGGGNQNDATAKAATVAGGKLNKAQDLEATVAGGDSNVANAQEATVGGGNNNLASGFNATVPGGQENEASGDFSFAAGYKAQATHESSFVWNGSESPFTVGSPDPYTFSVQANNGIWFGDDYSPSIGSSRFIDTSTGAYLSDGGTWTDSCSVTEKEAFEPTDGPGILEKVDSLDVSTWRYRDDDGNARHMGPTAEQFHETFGLGDDERHIAPLDTAGVALAAIQGLSKKLDEKDDRLERNRERIAELEAAADQKDNRLDTLEAENEALRERLAAVEDAIDLDEATGQQRPTDDGSKMGLSD
jgi:hypothetical protein